MSGAACLPKESIGFLRDLAAHNDKDWFAANKARCERDLVEPARSLLAAFLLPRALRSRRHRVGCQNLISFKEVKPLQAQVHANPSVRHAEDPTPSLRAARRRLHAVVRLHRL